MSKSEAALEQGRHEHERVTAKIEADRAALAREISEAAKIGDDVLTKRSGPIFDACLDGTPILIEGGSGGINHYPAIAPSGRNNSPKLWRSDVFDQRLRSDEGGARFLRSKSSAHRARALVHDGHPLRRLQPAPRFGLLSRA
jgi:hypothetical protein